MTVLVVSLAGALRTAMAWTDGRLIYALDDAYIHMAVAKNFANDGIWGCTPFHFSSSSSSLLWTLVLGVAYRAFGVHDETPLILNIALAVLTLVVTDRYLMRFGASPNGGFFLPNSLMLKAAGESRSALSALFKPFGREDIAFFQHSHGLLILLALGVLSALGQWHSGREIWRPRVLLPLLLALMTVMHGHFVFSPTFWVYRYDAYLVGLGIFVAAVVLAPLRAPGFLSHGVLPALVLASLVVIVADVKEGLVPDIEIGGMRNTYLEHYQAAEFIRRYYPREAVIVNDLGAVSYYNRTRILDLVGLGDVEPLEIMRRTGGYTSTDVRTWTAKYQPAIAIIQLGWSWIVPRVPSEWIKIAELEVPPNHQRVGFFAVNPKEAWVLRASVEQHYAPLGKPLGYRLSLRRPPP